MGGFLGEVEEVFADDAGDTVDGAVDFGDLGEFAGFEDDSGQGLVDDGRGAAALGDEDFAFEGHIYTSSNVVFPVRAGVFPCPDGISVAVCRGRLADHILPAGCRPSRKVLGGRFFIFRREALPSCLVLPN